MNAFDELTDYGHEHNVPILQDEGVEVLKELILTRHPRRFLEIGTAIGRTALLAASLWNDLEVVTIERDPLMAAKAREAIASSPYANRITLKEEDALTSVVEGKFDIIFIDAAKSQYKNFFNRYSPFLSDDGIIVTDNMFFHGLVEHPERTHNRHTKGLIRRLKAYHSFLETNDSFTTEILDRGDGIAITKRRDNA